MIPRNLEPLFKIFDEFRDFQMEFNFVTHFIQYREPLEVVPCHPMLKLNKFLTKRHQIDLNVYLRLPPSGDIYGHKSDNCQYFEPGEPLEQFTPMERDIPAILSKLYF